MLTFLFNIDSSMCQDHYYIDCFDIIPVKFRVKETKDEIKAR